MSRTRETKRSISKEYGSFTPLKKITSRFIAEDEREKWENYLDREYRNHRDENIMKKIQNHINEVRAIESVFIDEYLQVKKVRDDKEKQLLDEIKLLDVEMEKLNAKKKLLQKDLSTICCHFNTRDLRCHRGNKSATCVNCNETIILETYEGEM